jgi:hypothetical protein
MLRSTGLRPRFVDRLAERGIAVPRELFQFHGPTR